MKYQIDPGENEFLGEEEVIEQKSLAWRIAKGVIAFAVVIGFVFLSGGHQYFLYQRTSPSVQQQEVRSQIDAERFVVPLTIFIMDSQRTKEDIARLLENSDRIWEQASIDLEIKSIQELSTSTEDLQGFIQSFQEYDSSAINVFLVNNLNGINGISYGRLYALALADYTTVYDFRVLAHEIGHTLGLSHVPVDKGSLMYQGANGFNLSLQEITRARHTAERLQ